MDVCVFVREIHVFSHFCHVSHNMKNKINFFYKQKMAREPELPASIF